MTTTEKKKLCLAAVIVFVIIFILGALCKEMYCFLPKETKSFQGFTMSTADFDRHTWIVVNKVGYISSPTITHSPNCKCGGGSINEAR